MTNGQALESSNLEGMTSQVRLRAENLAEEARAAAAEPMPCVAVHVMRHPDERNLPHLARPYLVGPASLSMAQLEQVSDSAGYVT